MTADMRAHGVWREMKNEGDVPGGLAFHTKVVDCNFVLRFHIIVSFLCGGRATARATLPCWCLCLYLKGLDGFGKNELRVNAL